MEKREATIEDQCSSKCSHTDWLSFDLMREILMRLPAASLMRFRCVSKQWASITSNKDFIISFMNKSCPCLLLNFQNQDNQLFLLRSQQKNLGMGLPNVEKHHGPLVKISTFEFDFMRHHQSVNGLISLDYTNFTVIWNPTMRQHATFQKPNDYHTYLGYDLIGHTYKLFCMSYRSSEETHVLTLGAQESWRPIKYIPRCSSLGNGICINGVLYVVVSNGDRAKILSFDMKTEKFKLIQCMHKYLKLDLHLVNYKGRLAHVLLEEPSFSKLWVLEDGEKEEWSCQEFHIPFCPYDPVPNVYYCLLGVTDDGEFIYVSISWQDKKIHVSYYDPKRKSNRRIKIERFEDHEEFWLRNGLSNDKKFMGIMPNHIENIMSIKTLLA